MSADSIASESEEVEKCFRRVWQSRDVHLATARKEKEDKGWG